MNRENPMDESMNYSMIYSMIYDRCSLNSMVPHMRHHSLRCMLACSSITRSRSMERLRFEHNRHSEHPQPESASEQPHAQGFEAVARAPCHMAHGTPAGPPLSQGRDASSIFRFCSFFMVTSFVY